MFDTIFQQCLIHCCLAMCITTLGRLICDTGCCLKCSKEKPYCVWFERTPDPFKSLICVKNKSKKKIRRMTIQLCKANQGFRLRPVSHETKDETTSGVVIESKGDHWYKIEVKPRQIFTFELDFVPAQSGIISNYYLTFNNI